MQRCRPQLAYAVYAIFLLGPIAEHHLPLPAFLWQVIIVAGGQCWLHVKHAGPGKAACDVEVWPCPHAENCLFVELQHTNSRVAVTGLGYLLYKILIFRRWGDEYAAVPRFLWCFVLMIIELCFENVMVW